MQNQRMKYWQTTLAVLAVLAVPLAVAEDFKALNGKEYKNASVSRVEPDGIVLKTKSGISKVYFAELPRDVQERFNYDPQKASAFSAEQNAAMQKANEQLGKQQARIQWTTDQRANIASLRIRLQQLHQEKYNTMEQIRLVEAAPKYVETGRDSRGHIVRELNSAKADLPVLRDHLNELDQGINSVKGQLQQLGQAQ
jgi:hypothetical protein